MDIVTKRFDDAVSPVVGVILMVAVTVILAAVIGTFVLDLGNNVQANPQAGVSFDQTTSADQWDNNNDGTNEATGYKVTAQVISMENADEVQFKYANGDGAEELWTDESGTENQNYEPSSATVTRSSVGGTATFDHLTTGDTITVIGVLDGKETVLQSYTVEA